jgi:hypothetical protein
VGAGAEGGGREGRGGGDEDGERNELDLSSSHGGEASSLLLMSAKDTIDGREVSGMHSKIRRERVSKSREDKRRGHNEGQAHPRTATHHDFQNQNEAAECFVMNPVVGGRCDLSQEVKTLPWCRFFLRSTYAVDTSSLMARPCGQTKDQSRSHPQESCIAKSEYTSNSLVYRPHSIEIQ